MATNNRWINFLKAISLFVFFLIVTFIFFYYTNRIVQDNTNGGKVPVVNPNPTNIDVTNTSGDVELVNYIKLKTEEGFVSLLEKRGEIISPEFTANDQATNNSIANKFLQKNSVGITSTGKIESGYLYIKAGAGNPIDLLLPQESIYMYLSTASRGGHLYKPSSLIKIPTTDGYSQYLFKLDNINFTGLPYNDNNEPATVSWLEILQKNGTYPIGGFVSANRFSKIVEISIAYSGEKGALTLR